MKINSLKYKGFEAKGIEITKQDIQNLCILVSGVTAVIVLPTPSLKMKALTITLTALTAKNI